MKRVKRILAAVTAAAMALLIAPELGGEAFSQIGELMQDFAVSVSAEEGEAVPVETEATTAESEPVREETDNESNVTDDMTANDSIAAQSDVTIVDSGYCGKTNENEGKNVTWTLTSDGVLTICGLGDMRNYSQGGPNSSDMKSSIVTTVIIEDGVTSIGESAFWAAESLSNVTIPSSVKSIGGSAFERCTNLENVIISEGVISIGSNAFDLCRKLSSISIPNSVTSIGRQAFVECSNLSSISISNSVTSIGEQAFAMCTSLTSIIIPNNVASIGAGAFSYCDNLTSIIVEDSNLYFLSEGDALFNKDKTSLVLFVPGLSGNYAIPEGVTKIEPGAFWGCQKIKSILIPNGVESIGSWAFAGCKSLENMTIPNSVKNIGTNVFQVCSNLESITILPCGIDGIPYQTFNGCVNLKEIIILSDITHIGRDAFYNCSFTNFTIPNSVTHIYENAFGKCKNLTHLTIQGNVTSIGEYAFSGCSLYHIHIPENKTYSDYADRGGLPVGSSNYFPGGCGDPDCPLGGGNGTDISDKSGKCGDNAYWKVDSGSGYNEDLGYDCVLTISGSGDMYDYSLDSSNCAPWYNYREKIKFIIIEDGITGIGSSAFAGCNAVENIYFPSSVKKVSNNALLNCTALKSCIIANTLIEMSSSMLGYSSNKPDQSDKQLIMGLTVYSHGGSMAEFYAKQNNIAFENIHFPGEFVDFRGTVLEKKSSGMDSGMEYISHYFLELENNMNFYNDSSNLIVLGTACTPIITTNVVAISGSPNVYMSDYVGKIVLATGNLCVVAEEFILNECGYDPCIGNCMIVENARSCIVKWYNGETLLETQECPEKTIPEFKGTVPSCYDDEYGLKREFLGWTTKNNISYDIHIPEIPGVITGDTTFYAVFSDKEPEIDTSSEDLEKINYISEHMYSADRKEWNVDGVKYANDFRFDLQNDATETAHYIWRTVQMTDKSVNLNFLGIFDEIRANDYNVIMLDMFKSVEGYEVENIWNDYKNEGFEDFEDIVLGCLKDYLFKDDIKYEGKVRKALKNAKNGSSEELWEELQKICDETGHDLTAIVIPDWLFKTYEISEKVTGEIKTLKDIIDKQDEIVAYRMYKNMSDEYLDILIDMYHTADSIPDSEWEVKDLKQAIAYAINYQCKTDEQSIKAVVTDILIPTLYNKAGLKTSMTKFMNDSAAKFIDDAFSKNVAAGSAGASSINGADIVAAVQNGFKYGVKVSDALFDVSDQQDMYVKVKEYGVLSAVLQKVLDDKAESLLAAKTIDEQMAAALRYDKAYKMFVFTEGAASDNIAAYEKAFSTGWAVKAANGVVSAINFLISNNKLDKIAAQHVENSAVFADHAKFMRTLRCHTDGGLDLNEKILLQIYGQKLKEHKVIIVSCPVRMNVYDENHLLVGSLSKENSNVTKGYEDYIYRIEETDSCIACVPIDYNVEIIGLDDGTMKVIGSYYNGKGQESTFSYNNVPINSEYKSTVTVDVNKLELITADISPSKPSAPSNPSTDNSGNQGGSTINSTAPASTSFNVKLENKITGKTGKAKATRTDKNITINVGRENNGYYANIYNTNGNLIDSVKIKNGKAKFTISSDIDFYIVIDQDSHLEYEDVSSGAGIYELFEEKKEPFCMIIIVISALGFLSVAIAKRYQKNKR